MKSYEHGVSSKKDHFCTWRISIAVKYHKNPNSNILEASWRVKNVFNRKIGTDSRGVEPKISSVAHFHEKICTWRVFEKRPLLDTP